MNQRSFPIPPSQDVYLGFATYASGLAFNRVYRRELERFGLTYPQYVVLMLLWGQEGMTIGQLGAQLPLETNTLTPMLKRLESMGFLERQRDSQDERRVLLHLTEKGREVHDHSAKITASLVEAIGLPIDELMRLTADMQAVCHRLEAWSRDN